MTEYMIYYVLFAETNYYSNIVLSISLKKDEVLDVLKQQHFFTVWCSPIFAGSTCLSRGVGTQGREANECTVHCWCAGLRTDAAPYAPQCKISILHEALINSTHIYVTSLAHDFLYDKILYATRNGKLFSTL